MHDFGNFALRSGRSSALLAASNYFYPTQVVQLNWNNSQALRYKKLEDFSISTPNLVPLPIQAPTSDDVITTSPTAMYLYIMAEKKLSKYSINGTLLMKISLPEHNSASVVYFNGRVFVLFRTTRNYVIEYDEELIVSYF